MKRLRVMICTVLSLFFAFSIIGCSDNGLADCKAAAKTEIEAYAYEKGQENYSEDNWAALLALVEDGKEEIDNAMNENSVNSVIANIKQNIDEVTANLDGKDSELAVCKVAAIAEIETYAEEKGRGNYSEENWSVILAIVTNSKLELDNAKDEVSVKLVISDAKENIDKLLVEMPNKKLYSIRKAYDKGWLTNEEIKSIAYYGNGGRAGNSDVMDDEYCPLTKNPEILSEEQEKEICNDYFDDYTKAFENYVKANWDYLQQHERESILTIENIKIKNYCGTYGDCIAVTIGHNLMADAAVTKYTVDGVYFYDTAEKNFLIWVQI